MTDLALADSSAANSSNRSQVFCKNGKPLAIFLPLDIPNRPSLVTAIRVHGGTISDHLARSDIVIIDTETYLHSQQSRQLFRSAKGLQIPLPCVAATWITDSAKSGLVQNVHNAAYDPIALLDELFHREDRKQKTAHANAERQARMMREEAARNPQAALLHAHSRLGGKLPYNALDRHNIVEHLAITKQTPCGRAVADELVSKYGRHSRDSYQSHLRDNYEKGSRIRLLVEHLKATGVNPVVLPPSLRLASGRAHVGEALQPSNQAIANTARPSRVDASDAEVSDSEHSDDDDPIIASSNDRPPASRTQTHYQRSFRPHGVRTASVADAEDQRESTPPVREESRPRDEVTAPGTPHSPEAATQQSLRFDDFTDQEVGQLTAMVQAILSTILADRDIDVRDIEKDDSFAVDLLRSEEELQRGGVVWQGIAEITQHTADEWHDHFFDNMHHYLRIGKLAILAELEQSQSVQSSQPQSTPIELNGSAHVEVAIPPSTEQVSTRNGANGSQPAAPHHSQAPTPIPQPAETDPPASSSTTQSHAVPAKEPTLRRDLSTAENLLVDGLDQYRAEFLQDESDPPSAPPSSDDEDEQESASVDSNSNSRSTGESYRSGYQNSEEEAIAEALEEERELAMKGRYDSDDEEFTGDEDSAEQAALEEQRAAVEEKQSPEDETFAEDEDIAREEVAEEEALAQDEVPDQGELPVQDTILQDDDGAERELGKDTVKVEARPDDDLHDTDQTDAHSDSIVLSDTFKGRAMAITCDDSSRISLPPIASSSRTVIEEQTHRPIEDGRDAGASYSDVSRTVSQRGRHHDYKILLREDSRGRSEPSSPTEEVVAAQGHDSLQRPSLDRGHADLKQLGQSSAHEPPLDLDSSSRQIMTEDVLPGNNVNQDEAINRRAQQERRQRREDRRLQQMRELQQGIQRRSSDQSGQHTQQRISARNTRVGEMHHASTSGHRPTRPGATRHPQDDVDLRTNLPIRSISPRRLSELQQPFSDTRDDRRDQFKMYDNQDGRRDRDNLHSGIEDAHWQRQRREDRPRRYHDRTSSKPDTHIEDVSPRIDIGRYDEETGHRGRHPGVTSYARNVDSRRTSSSREDVPFYDFSRDYSSEEERRASAGSRRQLSTTPPLVRHDARNTIREHRRLRHEPGYAGVDDDGYTSRSGRSARREDVNVRSASRSARVLSRGDQLHPMRGNEYDLSTSRKSSHHRKSSGRISSGDRSRLPDDREDVKREAMKRRFQTGVTELARSFGFSDVRQLRPFMGERNDLKAARRRLETHFDNIASEHGVERAIVIACVTASAGSLLKAETALAQALSRRSSGLVDASESGDFSGRGMTSRGSTSDRRQGRGRDYGELLDRSGADVSARSFNKRRRMYD